jgi:DNA repair protein RecN (Recombination protein N)
LSKVKQIICVTHLAQIAAMSDVHFSISKSERNDRTFTHVTSLDREGRINELTRIMAGDVITESATLAAKEILINAEKFKKEIK